MRIFKSVISVQQFKMLMILIFLTLSNGLNAQTLNPPTLSVTTYCAGANITAAVTATGSLSAGTILTLQLSNSTGSFTTPVDIGTLTLSTTVNNYSGNLNGIIPISTTSGTGYRIRWKTATLTSASNTANITINAVPAVPSITSNSPVCSGGSINLSTSATGVNYSWSGPNSFTSVTQNPTISNATVAMGGTYTLTVTNASTNCVRQNTTTIIVNPIPTVNAVSNQTVCNNSSTTAVTFSGSVTGTTFAWTNNTPSIGLAASGNTNIASFTALNSSTSNVVATVTVTPSANSCTGTPSTFTYTVKPTPTISPITNQSLCNNAATTAITFNSNISGTTYAWTNNTTTTGLAASGSSNIASFTAVNTTNANLVSTVTVTPTFNACNGATASFSITVKPTPNVTTVPTQNFCHSTLTNAISLTGNVANTTFNWTNPNTAIGLAASGTGNIPAFTPNNTGTTNLSSVISVSPSANGCSGSSSTFTINVGPKPTMGSVSNQSVCANIMTTAVPFSSTYLGTNFSWTNNLTSIGLAASGNGNIPAFNSVNAGSTSAIASIVVTPTLNGCAGNPQTFSITVKPTPVVTAIPNQSYCQGVPVNPITISSNVTGASYAWTNNNSTIGLAASGTSNIPAFTPSNNGTTTVNATISIVPSFNGCNGATSNFTIAVKPKPVVNAVTSQTLCAGSVTSPVNFTGNISGTIYNWTNSNSTIGIAANGSGNIASFTTLNSNVSTAISSITVNPVLNGCSGTPINFTYSVKPLPIMNPVSDLVVCQGSNSGSINFSSSLTGTTYTWLNNNSAIGLPLSGSGNISNFTTQNSTFNPLTATVIVTPTANGCNGGLDTFTIKVNPKPNVDSLPNLSLCNGEPVQTIAFNGTVPGTVFNWTNSIASIGLPTSGIGNIPSFTATNNTTNITTSIIQVTPKANNCIGASKNFTITVKPTPKLTSTLTPSPICNKSEFNYQPTGNISGINFSWTRLAKVGISNPAASGNGNPTEVLVNTSSDTIHVVYNFVLSLNGCQNTQNVSVIVKPSPKLNTNKNFSICSRDTFKYTATSSTPNVNFTWIRNAVNGVAEAAASGSNIINESLTNTTNAPISVEYDFVLTSNGCTDTDKVYLVIGPRPQKPILTTKAPPFLCAKTMYQNFGAQSEPPVGTAYTWSTSNATIWKTSGNKQNALINFINGGSSEVSLICTNTASGCSSTTKYAVLVSSNEAIQPDVIYYNNRFICLQNGASNYIWGYDDASSLDSTLIAGEQNQDFVISNPDLVNKYYWVIFNYQGCLQKAYFNKPTSISTPNVSTFQSLIVHPNPTQNIVHVELKEDKQGAITFMIFDVTGKLVQTVASTNNEATIDLSDLTSGVYLVSAFKENQRIATSRIIKN